MCQIKGKVLGMVENMGTRDNALRSNVIDRLHVALENVYYYYQELASATSQMIRKISDHLPIAELSDVVGDKLAEHPVFSFILLTMVLSCAFPIVVFIIFTITSIIFTFVGFIFLEGTILTFGCLCLLGSLLFIILAMSVIAVAVLTLYFAFLETGKFIKNCTFLRTLAQNMLMFLTQSEEIVEVSDSD